jgi:lipopolysaccharide/colanic/teichoic acid biosynthesis glycosyltransferase
MADGTARAVGPAIATSLTGQGSLASAAAGVEPLRLVQRAPSRYERRLKPMVDRAAALLLLMLFSPLLLAVALLVRVNLGPGVLYRQVRIGQDGEPFSMLKFRTMQPDRRRTADGELRIDRRLGADRRSGDDRRQAVIAIDGPERRQGSDRRLGERRAPEGSRRRTHKTPDDPRHTRLGRFLRAYSLDELPQLINVLRGELSLVGPRPELPEVVANYEPWQHARHGVKPGITGLWQTTDRGNGEPMHLHVERDLEYIQRVSARMDVSILLLTVPVLLGLSHGNRGS